MAYLNEFPHFENNKQVLDWILKQYSTFNQRIQEIQDHFDEVAQGMAEQVAELEQDFTEFQTAINGQLDQFEDDIQGQLTDGLNNIQSQINVISTNMATYINEHMEEWQAEATYSGNLLRLSNSAMPILDYTEDIEGVVVDSKVHNVRLQAPAGITSETYTIFESDGYVLDANHEPIGITLDGIGTYLVILFMSVDTTTTPAATEPYIRLKGVNKPSEVNILIPLMDKVLLRGQNQNDITYIKAVGLFTNTVNSAKTIYPLMEFSELSTMGSGAISGVAYKLSKPWTPTI